MKKLTCVLIYLSFLATIYSQNNTFLKKFIKGNLSEKSAAVRESSGSDDGFMATHALKFVNENKPILGNDRDLSILAISSIYALPKNGYSDPKQNQLTSNMLLATFGLFEDENVRIAVLEKLPLFYTDQKETVNTINEFIKNNPKDAQSTKAALIALGTIGNSDSFVILYERWKNGKYPNFKTETEESLIRLSEQMLPEVVKIISKSKINENYAYVKLLVENSKINKNFKSEVAENALSQAIHNRELKNKISENEVDYQLLSLRIISDNQWSRASKLIVKYFNIAKTEYEGKILTEDQFIEVINATSKIGSSDSAIALSDYLATINKNMEQGISTETNIVLSVINNLGVLGDKISFDNLLYVTYLSYPEEVVNASRNALTKLKW